MKVVTILSWFISVVIIDTLIFANLSNITLAYEFFSKVAQENKCRSDQSELYNRTRLPQCKPEDSNAQQVLEKNEIYTTKEDMLWHSPDEIPLQKEFSKKDFFEKFELTFYRGDLFQNGRRFTSIDQYVKEYNNYRHVPSRRSSLLVDTSNLKYLCQNKEPKWDGKAETIYVLSAEDGDTNGKLFAVNVCQDTKKLLILIKDVNPNTGKYHYDTYKVIREKIEFRRVVHDVVAGSYVNELENKNNIKGKAYAAGIISVEGGELKSFDNCSGHFKPDKKSLKVLLDFFKEKL